jgi:signal transduction histidine kinase
MTNSGKTILVIDDEEMMREAVKAVLESEGYTVLESSNGEDGLQAAVQRVPDLVLCDIEMPGLSGFDVLHMFRENPITAVVPFVFLSGRSKTTDRRKGMQLGADDFLTKPFDSKELLATVNTRLLRREQEIVHAEKKLEKLRLNISTSVPHELRTPLTGILGFAQILKEQATSSSPEELSEIADHILGSATRLQITLEKFWTYAEIMFLSLDGASRKSLKRETFPRADSLIKVLARERAATFQREGDLEFVLPSKLCLKVSSDHLKIMLTEVIDNAFKFSPSKTPVTIECSDTPESSRCEIHIRDRGRGMDMHQVNSVAGFMQFDRGRHEQQGLGLGLSMARELARLYEGDLTIKSIPGEGTTAVFLLPVCQS